MIELVIADDHPLVREGVKKILDRKKKMGGKVIGEAANAEELFGILKQDHLPDLILLDINMPGKNGLEILKEIRHKYSSVPVLILSMHPAERYAVRSIKAGAAGYLNKGNMPDVIEEAIDTVVNKKKKYINATVAEELAKHMDNGDKQLPHLKLSDREYQVLCLIASGKKVHDIAEELSISVRTVHTYRKRMLDKMNLNTNVEVTHYALHHQLIDQP